MRRLRRLNKIQHHQEKEGPGRQVRRKAEGAGWAGWAELDTGLIPWHMIGLVWLVFGLFVIESHKQDRCPSVRGLSQIHRADLEIRQSRLKPLIHRADLEIRPSRLKPLD